MSSEQSISSLEKALVPEDVVEFTSTIQESRQVRETTLPTEDVHPSTSLQAGFDSDYININPALRASRFTKVQAFSWPSSALTGTPIVALDVLAALLSNDGLASVEATTHSKLKYDAIEVMMQVNSTEYDSGVVALSGQPGRACTSMSQGSGAVRVRYWLNQSPDSRIGIATEDIRLTLPWQFPSDNISLVDKQPPTTGTQVVVVVVHPLDRPGKTSSAVQGTLYARFINPQWIQPCTAHPVWQSSMKYAGEQIAAQGPITDAVKSLSTVVGGAVSMVSAEAGSAIKTVGSTVGAVTDVLGLSAPSTGYMRKIPALDPLCYGVGPSSSVNLGISPLDEPRNPGPAKIFDIKQLGRRYSYVFTANTDTDIPLTLSPSQLDYQGFTTHFPDGSSPDSTPLYIPSWGYYASLPYQYWRGGFDFRVQSTGSLGNQFRLAVLFIPEVGRTISAADIQLARDNPLIILDFSKSRVAEFTVPYSACTPFLRNNSFGGVVDFTNAFGTLIFTADLPLITGNPESTEFHYILEYRFGEDFQLAGLREFRGVQPLNIGLDWVPKPSPPTTAPEASAEDLERDVSALRPLLTTTEHPAYNGEHFPNYVFDLSTPNSRLRALQWFNSHENAPRKNHYSDIEIYVPTDYADFRARTEKHPKRVVLMAPASVFSLPDYNHHELQIDALMRFGAQYPRSYREIEPHVGDFDPSSTPIAPNVSAPAAIDPVSETSMAHLTSRSTLCKASGYAASKYHQIEINLPAYPMVDNALTAYNYYGGNSLLWYLSTAFAAFGGGIKYKILTTSSERSPGQISVVHQPGVQSLPYDTVLNADYTNTLAFNDQRQCCAPTLVLSANSSQGTEITLPFVSHQRINLLHNADRKLGYFPYFTSVGTFSGNWMYDTETPFAIYVYIGGGDDLRLYFPRSPILTDTDAPTYDRLGYKDLSGWPGYKPTSIVAATAPKQYRNFNAVVARLASTVITLPDGAADSIDVTPHISPASYLVGLYTTYILVKEAYQQYINKGSRVLAITSGREITLLDRLNDHVRKIRPFVALFSMFTAMAELAKPHIPLAETNPFIIATMAGLTYVSYMTVVRGYRAMSYYIASAPSLLGHSVAHSISTALALGVNEVDSALITMIDSCLERLWDFMKIPELLRWRVNAYIERPTMLMIAAKLLFDDTLLTDAMFFAFASTAWPEQMKYSGFVLGLKWLVKWVQKKRAQIIPHSPAHDTLLASLCSVVTIVFALGPKIATKLDAASAFSAFDMLHSAASRWRDFTNITTGFAKMQSLLCSVLVRLGLMEDVEEAKLLLSDSIARQTLRLADEIDYLVAHKGKLIYSTVHRKKVFAKLEEVRKFTASLTLSDRKYVNLLFSEKVKELEKLAEVANRHRTEKSRRPTPFHIFIESDVGGTGKSEFARLIAEAVCSSLGIPIEEIYYRPSNSKFWDGFAGQWIYVGNEWGLSEDHEDVRETQDMIGTGVFIPPQAFEKDTVFRGRVVINTSNKGSVVFPGYDAYSIFRRRHLWLRAVSPPLTPGVDIDAHQRFRVISYKSGDAHTLALNDHGPNLTRAETLALIAEKMTAHFAAEVHLFESTPPRPLFPSLKNEIEKAEAAAAGFDHVASEFEENIFAQGPTDRPETPPPPPPPNSPALSNLTEKDLIAAPDFVELLADHRIDLSLRERAIHARLVKAANEHVSTVHVPTGLPQFLALYLSSPCDFSPYSVENQIAAASQPNEYFSYTITENFHSAVDYLVVLMQKKGYSYNEIVAARYMSNACPERLFALVTEPASHREVFLAMTMVYLTHGKVADALVSYVRPSLKLSETIPAPYRQTVSTIMFYFGLVAHLYPTIPAPQLVAQNLMSPNAKFMAKTMKELNPSYTAYLKMGMVAGLAAVTGFVAYKTAKWFTKASPHASAPDSGTWAGRKANVYTRMRNVEAHGPAKVVPHVAPIPSGGNMLDIARKIIKGNLVVVNNGNGNMYALRYGPRNLLIPSHFFDSLQRDFTTFYCNGRRTPYSLASELDVADLMLVDVAGFPAAPGMAKHLLSLDEYASVGFQAINIAYAYRDVDGQVQLKTTVTAIPSDQILNYNRDGRAWSNQIALEYYAMRQAGDCGLPIFISEGPFAGKLLGFHIAGSVSGRSFMQLICKEHVESLEKVLDMQRSDKIVPQGPNRIAALASLSESIRTLPARMNSHGLTIIGHLQHPIFQPELSQIRSSPYANEIVPVAHERSIISLNDPRILNQPVETMRTPFDGVLKNAGNDKTIPEDILTPTILHFYDRMRYGFSKCEVVPMKGKLSTQEAILGTGDGMIPPLPRQSSSGYPFVLTGVKRSTLLDEYNANPERSRLGERLRIRRAMAPEGRTPDDSIAIDCLKDELLKPSKIATASSRIFTIMPLDHTIDLRSFVAPFQRNCQMIRTVIPPAVGINPYSYDFASLIEDFDQFGSSLDGRAFFDIDYAGFDGCVTIQHALAFLELLRLVMDLSPDEYNYLLLLLLECIFTKVLLKDMIYVKEQGNPSGNAATTILNCWTNVFVVWAAVIILLRRYGKYLSPADVSYYLCIKVFGDDLIGAFKRVEFKADHGIDFPLHELAGVLTELGFAATDANKTAEVSWKTINELVFLKNTPVRIPSMPRVWFAAPQDSVLSKLANWYTGEMDITIRRNHLLLLCFAAHRPDFDDVQDKLAKAYDRRRKFYKKVKKTELLDLFYRHWQVETWNKIEERIFGDRLTTMPVCEPENWFSAFPTLA